MHFGRLAAISMTLAFLGAPAYAASSAADAHGHTLGAPHKKHDAAKKRPKKHAKKTLPKGHQR
jgi:hypothetical protein